MATMTGFAMLIGLLCVFGGLQSGVLAQDGEKFSYPSALERIESLVGSLNESLHETKEDLQEVRLCLNQTKKKLGEVQRDKETLKAQLLETRNELAASKSLHQQEIDQVKMKVSDLQDEELPRQLNELSGDLSDVTRDLRRLEDENLPRRINELAIDYHRVVIKLATAEFRHNFTTYKLMDELRQLKSEAQKLANKLEAALSTLPDEQLVDRMEELADKYDSLQLKLVEVEVGEEEWESRIGMSRAMAEIKGSLNSVESRLSNLSATMEQGLNVTRANFSKMKDEVEVVETELCEKVLNLTTQVEDAQQRSTQSVSDLNQKVHTTNTVTSQQQESIDSLRRDLRQQGVAVTRLSDRVTQHDVITDRLKQRVAEQESNVSRLASNIQMRVYATENLTNTVAEQGVCIAQLKRDVEQITTDARNLQYRQKNVSNDVMQLMKWHRFTSCEDLYQFNPATPSGYYYISTPRGVKRVYCEMETSNCGDVRGGWMRVAQISMTDPRHTCPQGLRYIVKSSKRMCAHSGSGRGCSSITFPQHGVPYTKVCGRARGYQYSYTESFGSYHSLNQSLEGYYVQGLSVTHGSPRNHIWTFAAGVSKDASYWSYNCPCARYHHIAVPPFVGENYYCESGHSEGSSYLWQVDDPLWDSQGCPDGSTCCDRGGPWFTATLNQEVSDDIEVRWCSPRLDAYVGVDQLEIFVH